MKSDAALPGTTDESLAAAFRVLLLAAARRVADQAEARLDADTLAGRFAFLADYAQAWAECEVEHPAALARWTQATGWSESALELWLACGLPDEDARFGDVFEALDPAGRARRPGLALMQAWWGTLHGQGAGAALRQLLQQGLVQPCTGAGARADTLYEVEENCWLAARGEAPPQPAPGVQLLAPPQAPAWDTLVLPAALQQQLGQLTPWLAAEGGTLLVRGPRHNGRHSLLAALARAEGRASLLVDWPPEPGAAAPAWLGSFATLTGARVVLRLQAAPGERVRLPALAGPGGWMGVACADDAAVAAPEGPVWSVSLPLPDAAQRRALIESFGAPWAHADAAALADRLHLASGALVRALRQDRGPAAAGGALVQRWHESALAAGSADLASLAERLPARAGTPALVLDAELAADLDALEARCRQRERLREALPEAAAARLNGGVRALLAGPSGTGKTLAAQVLAGRLGVPLYRLDLSSVVSKYIGETERNLHRVLDSAEALDVMLLLDEGDALLARRTEVGNAHDRYANLETSFLLQRLESHRGLVLVTTNALERIDTAFLRRFDHLLHFRAPEPHERLALWHAHLPAGHHVTAAQLEALAEACALAGGQIRNVALAATSAALATGRPLDDPMLVQAVRREYRRSGQLCPLGPA